MSDSRVSSPALVHAKKQRTGHGTQTTRLEGTPRRTDHAEKENAAQSAEARVLRKRTKIQNLLDAFDPSTDDDRGSFVPSEQDERGSDYDLDMGGDSELEITQAKQKGKTKAAGKRSGKAVGETVALTPKPPKKRGRPPKSRPFVVSDEEEEEDEEVQPKATRSKNKKSIQSKKAIAVSDQGEPEVGGDSDDEDEVTVVQPKSARKSTKRPLGSRSKIAGAVAKALENKEQALAGAAPISVHRWSTEELIRNIEEYLRLRGTADEAQNAREAGRRKDNADVLLELLSAELQVQQVGLERAQTELRILELQVERAKEDGKRRTAEALQKALLANASS